MQNIREIAIYQIWTDPDWKENQTYPKQNHFKLKFNKNTAVYSAKLINIVRSIKIQTILQLNKQDILQNSNIYQLNMILFRISLTDIGIGLNSRCCNLSWISLFRFNFVNKWWYSSWMLAFYISTYIICFIW